MGIVADALDILQGEKFMYMGLYSLTITRLLQRLGDLKNLKYCDCLVRELRISINRRYGNQTIFDFRFSHFYFYSGFQIYTITKI